MQHDCVSPVAHKGLQFRQVHGLAHGRVAWPCDPS
ncbi:hypothetical protein F383_24593 [Gossypium arboreum]|uniref:Uncharacterized protein n=1 Tax=Gossypium arboreum TaxID=29729 RepID=A0A0B0MP75_GOSAR|nr:hypothetical protein F383_24593 [Gossypium arboreum]